MDMTDQNIWIALGLIAVALVLAFWPKRKTVSLGTPATPPGRALIDAFEESGKDGAGAIIQAKLGDQKAAEIMASLGSAFSPTQAAPAAPSSPSSVK